MDHYYSYEDFIGPITLHTLHFDYYIRSYASIMWNKGRKQRCFRPGEIKQKERHAKDMQRDATIDPLVCLVRGLSKIDDAVVHHVKLWTVKKLKEHCIFSHYMAVHQL